MNTQDLRWHRGIVAAVCGASALVACIGDTPSSPNRLPSQNGNSIASDFGIDLPCEVATLLLEHCAGCHAGAQAFAPKLERHADLVAPSSQPDMTVADAALASMRGTITAMPPAGLLSEADILPLEAWIADGMPAGNCEGLVPPPPAELVCTSNAFRFGDDGDEDMFPGRACNQCHRSENDEEEEDEAPLFAFAGTVYPTVREPDNCIGLGGAVVTLRDAVGREWQLTTRTGSGNFMMTWPASGVTFPVSASVSRGGGTLEMMQPLASPADGDCNRCHTQDGENGAKGRIFAP